MRTHSFDVDLATKYGVPAAILLRHIMFWCEKNRANGEHLHDGKYWTYTSRKALREMFPYLGDKQIRNATDKLVEEGLLEVGNYNDLPYDRTLWYSVTNKAFEVYYGPSPQLAKYRLKPADADGTICPNDNSHLPKGQTNTRYNPDIYNTPSIILTDNTSPKGDAQSDDLFSAFWKAYPRKTAKPAAERAFRKAHISDLTALLADIERRKRTEDWQKDKGKYIPHPATYLNQRRWEDDDCPPEGDGHSAAADPPAGHFRFYGVEEES